MKRRIERLEKMLKVMQPALPAEPRGPYLSERVEARIREHPELANEITHRFKELDRRLEAAGMTLGVGRLKRKEELIRLMTSDRELAAFFIETMELAGIRG